MKKNNKIQFLKNKYLLVMIACLLIGLVVTCVVFFENSERQAAVSTVLFVFDGATNGCTPDGEEFDIRSMEDDAILEGALEACNMSPKYTAEQLRGSLFIRGDYPADIADEILGFESVFDYGASKTFTNEDFHATWYTIALYNDFDKTISKTLLSQLLSAVMTGYRDSFIKQHSKVWDASLMELKLENYDYIQRLTILKERMDEAAVYAKELYKKEPGILIGGEGFNDVYIRMQNLSENEIPRLQALVIIGGLSKDYERLLIQYEYEIEDLCIQLKYQKDRLKEAEQLLSSYEKNDVLYISSGEELVKIDGNSSQTYDKLVEERREIADGITEIRSDISERLLRMEDILGDDVENSQIFAEVNELLIDQMGEEQYEQMLVEAGVVSSEMEEISEEIEDTTNNEDEEDVEAIVDDGLPEENTETTVHKGREDMATELVALDAEIKALEEKVTTIESDFNNMLSIYNEMNLNDNTIIIAPTQLVSKKLISGAFIKTGIKCAGPFVSIGIMLCVVMILQDMKKKEKKTKA